MACAPPIAKSSDAPASSAAAMTTGAGRGQTTTISDDAGDARRHDGHEKRRRQRIAAARHVAADARERLHALLDPQPWRDGDGETGAAPARSETRSRCVTAWASARRTSRGVCSQPRRRAAALSAANGRRPAVEPPRPVPDRDIAAPADVADDARGLPLDIRAARFVTSRQRSNGFTVGRADDSHQSTILLRGYSTIPEAFAFLSFGISSRTVCSSMIVFTATQPSSLNGEIVGR